MIDLQQWQSGRLEHVDRTLRARFQQTWPGSFLPALQYPLFTGGKRVRPLLAIAAYEAVTGHTDLTPVIPACVAVELIHTYSLVHDDLPAMDDDDERRGRPTVHRAFDEATAILCGDALLTEAFAVLADAPLPAEQRIQLVRELSLAAGANGMVGGQVADIQLGASITEVDTLRRVHALKTGALIRFSTLAGGLSAQGVPGVVEQLAEYGKCVGLAFQLADDILDADQDAGEDGPPSYVRLLGIDETRRQAYLMVEEAIEAVHTLPQPDALVALARFIVERDV